MSDVNFGEPSGGGFIDEHFDFARCQRPDGSFYGTGGTCRMGTPAGAKEKEAKAAPKAGSKGAARAEISAKAKEVKELDKQAKAANKAADAAEKQWRKGGMKDKALQKEVRRLDKEAKAKDKEADKASKELSRMRSAQERGAKRDNNVKLNQALQAGPKATTKQRAMAVRFLQSQKRSLESREDEGTLSKAGQARLKLINSSLKAYARG